MFLEDSPLAWSLSEFGAESVTWAPDGLNVMVAGTIAHDVLEFLFPKDVPLPDHDQIEAAVRLPHPHSFEDKGGKVRLHVRVKCWNGDALTWRQVAMSVPDINQLPDTPLSDDLSTAIYPDGDTPVFFGHYWMSGNPELQSANALCLDYSAGADGPLVTYSHFAGSCYLSLENVAIHR